jgi:hypothetical protein
MKALCCSSNYIHIRTGYFIFVSVSLVVFPDHAHLLKGFTPYYTQSIAIGTKDSYALKTSRHAQIIRAVFSSCVPLPQALPISSSFLIASLVPAHVLLGIFTNLFITLQSDIMHTSCKVYCMMI